MLSFGDWLLEYDWYLKHSRVHYSRDKKETLRKTGWGGDKETHPHGERGGGQSYDEFKVRQPRNSQRAKTVSVPLHKIRSSQETLDRRSTPMHTHKRHEKKKYADFKHDIEGSRQPNGTYQVYDGNHRINHAIRSNRKTVKMKVHTVGDKKFRKKPE